MPQALALIAPLTFGSGGTFALLGATAGSLTLAGSVVSIVSSLAINAALGALNQPAAVKPENIKLTLQQAIGDRIRHYGRVQAGGTVVFYRARAGFFYRVVVHGHGEIDGIEEYLLNKEVVTLDGSNFVEGIQYFSKGRKRVQILGRSGVVPETNYDEIEAIWPVWDEDHRLDGLWTSLTIAEQVNSAQFRRVYPNGEPALALTARGSKLRDPRTGTTVWSDNAALAIADLIEHPDGFNLAGLVDDDFLEVAADDSDEPITKADASTEPRYRICGSYSLTEQPGAVLRRMLTACAGQVQLLPSGKVGIRVGRWRDPDVTLTRSELIEITDWTNGPDKLDRYTELPFTYVDPDLAFQPTTGDTWVDAARETENGEAAIGPEVDMSLCPEHTQGRRVMQQRIEIDNPAFTLTARWKPSARRALYEPFIGVDVAELPSAWWRVKGYALSLADGSLTLRLAAYAPPTWLTDYEGAPQVLPDPDDEEDVPEPEGFTAIGSGVGAVAGIAAEWDPPPSDALTPVLEFSPAGADAWDSWPLAEDTVETTLAPLEDGQDYDLRLAFETEDGLRSDWVTLTSVEAASVPPLTTALAALTEPGTLGVSQIVTGWRGGDVYVVGDGTWWRDVATGDVVSNARYMALLTGNEFQIDQAPRSRAFVLAHARAGDGAYVDIDGIVRTAATNELRYDYLLGVRAALIEPAATNLALWSQDLGNAAWATTGIVGFTTAGVAAPNLGIAQVMTETSGGPNRKGIRQDKTIVAGTPHSISVLAREHTSGSKRYLGLSIHSASTSDWVAARYDLAAGTVTSTNVTGTGYALGSATIKQLGTTGWYLCTLTGTIASNTDARFRVGLATSTNTYSAVSTGQESYTGDGVSGLVYGGIQIEAGDPTSYILTTTAAVTRAADVVSMQGITATLDVTAVYADGTFDGFTAFSVSPGAMPTLTNTRLRRLVGRT